MFFFLKFLMMYQLLFFNEELFNISTDSIAEVVGGVVTETVEFVGVISADATSHYEDPNTTGSCQKGEIAVQIQGVKGGFCSPRCGVPASPCTVASNRIV